MNFNAQCCKSIMNMPIAVYRSDLCANYNLPIQLMIIHARYVDTLSLGVDTFQGRSIAFMGIDQVHLDFKSPPDLSLNRGSQSIHHSLIGSMSYATMGGPKRVAIMVSSSLKLLPLPTAQRKGANCSIDLTMMFHDHRLHSNSNSNRDNKPVMI